MGWRPQCCRSWRFRTVPSFQREALLGTICWQSSWMLLVLYVKSRLGNINFAVVVIGSIYKSSKPTYRHYRRRRLADIARISLVGVRRRALCKKVATCAGLGPTSRLPVTGCRNTAHDRFQNANYSRPMLRNTRLMRVLGFITYVLHVLKEVSKSAHGHLICQPRRDAKSESPQTNI